MLILPFYKFLLGERRTCSTTRFHSPVPALSRKRNIKVKFFTMYCIKIFIHKFRQNYWVSGFACTIPFWIVFQKQGLHLLFAILSSNGSHSIYKTASLPPFFQHFCKIRYDSFIMKIEKALTRCNHIKAILWKINIFCGRNYKLNILLIFLCENFCGFYLIF